MDVMDPAESENPFASPETVGTRDGYLHVYGPERARMPQAVMWVLGYAVAVMAGWIWMAWDAFGGAAEAREFVRPGFDIRAFWLNCVLGGCTFVVVLLGVLRRNLLVYRFVRLTVTTLATLLLASSGYVLWQIVSSKAETHATLYLYFAFVVATVVTWSMLYRQSTKAYFGLKCPECGTVRGVQANFLQTRVWCRTCRVTW